MMKLKTLSMVLCAAALATTAHAQTSSVNRAPVCATKTLTLGSMVGDIQLTEINIDPLKVPPACTDADGDTIKVISVDGPSTLMPNGEIKIKLALKGRQSAQISFTVSDGKGGKATSSLTIVRE